MLDAIQSAIVAAIRSKITPQRVPTIYLVEVPADFERPSFFLYPAMPFRGEGITTHLRQYDLNWQIVYFPLLDAFGNEDRNDLLSMGGSLEDLFGLSDSLLPIPELPTGANVAQITGFSYEIRDGVGYGSLQCSFFLLNEETPDALLHETTLNINN